MAYKAGLEQWSLAVKAYEEQNYEEALNIFTDMGGGSKIQYNIGNIYSLLGDNDLAIASFTASIQLDGYFAIGYFARGISNFHIGDLESAFEDFNNALLYLRGNLFIDYFQLGMDFKLYSCEVLYNRAICYFNMNQPAEAMNDLLAAFNDKNEDKHTLIAHALEVAGKGCDLFAVPTGTIFRPCESMVRNTKKIDYLGQAKLIAANNAPPTVGLQRSKTERKFPEPAKKEVPISPISGQPLQRRGTAGDIHSSAPTTPPVVPQMSLLRKISLASARGSHSAGASRVGIPASLDTNTRPVDITPAPLSATILKRSMTLPHQGPLSATLPTTPNNLNDTDRLLHIPKFSPIMNANPPSIPSQDTNNPRTPLCSSPEDDAMFPSPPSLTNSYTSLPSPNGYTEPELKFRAPVPKGKMKVKCHFGDTRTLMVNADISFEELQLKIQKKFSVNDGLKLRYKDEDEELVLITDQEDLDMALDSLCPNSDGTVSHLDPGSGFDGRFEIWCSS